MKHPKRVAIFPQPWPLRCSCLPQFGHDQKLVLGSGTDFPIIFPPKWVLKKKSDFWKFSQKIIYISANNNARTLSCRKGNRGQNISALSLLQDKTSPLPVQLNCPLGSRINTALESEVTRTNWRKWVNSLFGEGRFHSDPVGVFWMVERWIIASCSKAKQGDRRQTSRNLRFRNKCFSFVIKITALRFE